MSSLKSTDELKQSAKAAFENKDFSEAARIFRQIADMIDPNEQPVAHAEARNNLSVALLKLGQPQAAFDQAVGTDSIFAERGLIDEQAMALGNTGTALVDLGRLDEALDCYQRSAALFKETGNTAMRGYVLQEISALQMKRGKQVESLFAMDAALENKKKLTPRESLLKKLMKVIHRAMKSG